MNCTCNVAQRRLTPGVFNLKQYLNGAETMKWRLTTHYTDAGQCDLCDYEAFLAICVGGRMDEIKLTKSMIQPTDPDAEHILELSWNVGQYATELTGYTKYQIIFRSAKIGQLGVIGASDEAANGVYTIDSELVDGTYRTWTNHAEGSGYKIKWDGTNKRWTIYKADGATVVDYQTFTNPEPCCGTWSTVAVGNSTAVVWTSDEAIMYISETLAADQSVTASFPTILRQVWEAVRAMIIKSGVSVMDGEITASDWQGSAAPYYINVPDKITGVPTGCTVVGAQLFKAETGGGYTDIGNIKLEHGTDGTIKLYSLQKVTGKLIVSIKGGNGYFISKDTDLGAAAIKAVEAAKDAEEAAETAQTAVTSVTAKAEEVTNAVATVEAAKTSASNSATAAADSATAAAQSATKAEKSENNAAASEYEAAANASAAATSETNAAASAEAAATSATNAAASATEATNAAEEVKTATYTKAEIDTKLNAKAATSHTHTIANVTGLQTALDGKANASTTYSKTEVDGKIANKVDEETYGTAIGILNGQVATLNQQMSERVLASQVYTKGEVDTKLSMKVDASTYGLKMNEITLSLDEKAKASEVYSKTEIDNKFGTFETQANAVIGGN